MEIKITGKHIRIVLLIICGLIFVGVCIEAGGFISNIIYALYKPSVAAHYWQDLDLSPVYNYDKGQFVVVTTFMSIPAVFRCIIFYLIIKLLMDNKLSLSQPFSKYLVKFISLMAWLALGTGLFSAWGAEYVNWLESKNIAMPGIHELRLGGADVWLFMGVVLLVIAQLFKRGVEIQSENELTV
jgi:hypothetical protein